MSPNRKIEIGNEKIEEFYWNARMVVYVNNRATELTYEEAVDRALANQEPNPQGAEASDEE